MIQSLGYSFTWARPIPGRGQVEVGVEGHLYVVEESLGTDHRAVSGGGVGGPQRVHVREGLMIVEMGQSRWAPIAGRVGNISHLFRIFWVSPAHCSLPHGQAALDPTPLPPRLHWPPPPPPSRWLIFSRHLTPAPRLPPTPASQCPHRHSPLFLLLRC